MIFSPNDPAVSLIDQLFDILVGETDARLYGALSATTRLRIAIEHTDEARASASAFIIASATDIAADFVGAQGVFEYLDELDDTFELYGNSDAGAERRATLAWRDCVIDDDSDIAARSALYNMGDLGDSAAGLLEALITALWMVVYVIDPAGHDRDAPMNALDLLSDFVEMARSRS